MPAVPDARIALIGAGAFGLFCLEAYRQTEDIAVVGVADPRLGGATLGTHPAVPVAADWRFALEDPSVEAIHLATPPHLRGEIAIPALRAGKSVLSEKPLALSLPEADRMIEVSRATGSVLGIDYVMRHHPAFTLLPLLASSGLFGSLRTLSLQNFAQALPSDHWMWDTSKSGGILAEHGVHFFDAYGMLAGLPARVRGYAPRKEAVQVAVEYEGDALGLYFHEFAFPGQIERTCGTVFFERGYVEVDGWIPERLCGAVMAPAQSLSAAAAPSGVPIEVWEEGGAARFAARFNDRRQAYQDAIVDGMRDLLARSRDREHAMTVTAEDARDSLALALSGQRAADTGAVVPIRA